VGGRRALGEGGARGCGRCKKSNGEVLVFPPASTWWPRGGSYQPEDAADAEGLVERVKAELAAIGVKASGRVEASLEGRAAKAILQAAKSEGADVIVMGSRGLCDLGGLLLGSVTHKLIQLSHWSSVVMIHGWASSRRERIEKAGFVMDAGYNAGLRLPRPWPLGRQLNGARLRRTRRCCCRRGAGSIA